MILLTAAFDARKAIRSDFRQPVHAICEEVFTLGEQRWLGVAAGPPGPGARELRHAVEAERVSEVGEIKLRGRLARGLDFTRTIDQDIDRIEVSKRISDRFGRIRLQSARPAAPVRIVLRCARALSLCDQ